MPIKDKDENRIYQKTWVAARREEAIDLFGRVCNYCKDTSGPFDFDHIDPSTKKYSINTLWSGSIELRQEELAKCQLLCRKCHTEKSSQEKRKVFQHGTEAMYRHCVEKCRPCKDAHAEDRRMQRAKRAAKLAQ